MRTRLSIALVMSLSAWAFPAQAQIGLTKPIITITPLSPGIESLTINEITEDAPIVLEWTVQLGGIGTTYDYEITYDVASTTTTVAERLILADDVGTPNHDTAEGGTFTVRVLPTNIVRVEELPGGSAPVDDGQRQIVIRVYKSDEPFNEDFSATANWIFEYDTSPPPPPTITAVLPGDKRLQAEFTAPADDTDVANYEVFWTVDAEGTGVVDPDTASSKQIGTTDSRVSIDGDLENGVLVSIVMRSIDDVGNRGELSNVVTGAPTEVADFFELYRAQGGTEDGGFCFIATAAYGSYAHPAVELLRDFRDYVMKPTLLGSLLVEAYYAVSPPVAEQVRKSPALASLVRAALWPVAIAAAVVTPAPYIAALCLVLFVGFRRRRVRAGAVASLGVALVLAVSTEASAKRPDSTLDLGLGFEFKGGLICRRSAKPTRPAPAFLPSDRSSSSASRTCCSRWA